MYDFDLGFPFLLGKNNAPPPDPRFPFAKAFVSAEVRSFISFNRLMFKIDSDYPLHSANQIRNRAVHAYLEAGEWAAASSNPELLNEERREFRMNANVLADYAKAMEHEAALWDARSSREWDD